GSMQGQRLTSLKSELTNSLDGLLTASSFLVVLFNSDAVPLGGRVKWIDASEPAKRRIYEMLGKVVAGGGTHPSDALEIAFSLKPRPDAIYFMTDGLFDTAVAEQVARLNRQERNLVPIHCIAFGTRDAEALMRQIAQASGGSFTYIAGP
ncbi:MAG: vWA domain-containing protein, partial [Phycisphaerales bacterium]